MGNRIINIRGIDSDTWMKAKAKAMKLGIIKRDEMGKVVNEALQMWIKDGKKSK